MIDIYQALALAFLFFNAGFLCSYLNARMKKSSGTLVIHDDKYFISIRESTKRLVTKKRILIDIEKR